jgi:hypothetical protein
MVSVSGKQRSQDRIPTKGHSNGNYASRKVCGVRVLVGPICVPQYVLQRARYIWDRGCKSEAEDGKERGADSVVAHRDGQTSHRSTNGRGMEMKRALRFMVML